MSIPFLKFIFQRRSVMKLGDKIKKLREGKNISQKELAGELGVTDAMISMYENDKKNPSLDVITKIAMFFNVSTDYLLGTETMSDNELPKNIRAVARDLLDLPEENRKLAIDMIKSLSKKADEAKKK